MLVPGDLGFTGLVLVFIFFFFFCPIISFLIQKKWRIAVEKKEEIMRLVAMASEEAARAEFEATSNTNSTINGGSVGFDDFGVVSKQFKCAVCFCPTTTRCSRCKLVRYCSGKCQIIHWRRGHKEECHPPTTFDTHSNGSESDSDQLSQAEQNTFHGRVFETESKWNIKPSKKFSKRDTSSKFSFSPVFSSARDENKVEDLMGNKAHFDSRFSDTSSVNFSSSMTSNESDTSFLRFSSSTTSNESSGVSVSEGSVCHRRSRSRGPVVDDVSPVVVGNTIDVNDTNLLPPDFSESISSVNNRIYNSSKVKPKTSSCRPGGLGRESSRYSGSYINGLDECTVPVISTIPSDFVQANFNMYSGDDSNSGTKMNEDGDHNLSEYGSAQRFPFNTQNLDSDVACFKRTGNTRPVDRGTPPVKTVRNASTVGDLPVKLSKLPEKRCNDQGNEHIPESKGRRSLSSIGSERHQCCGTRRNSTSTVKPPKVDRIHSMSNGTSEVTSSSAQASSGLKTSVRKVVQQFRVPKPLKHNLFGSSEVAEKNSYKMLFPYDLFIKLYSWGIELRPCGLMNCGNSCYANSVLQCLAFTQPLTAYLIQGLHSKACPRNEWCFTCEFECLIQKASEGNSPLSPIGILSKLQSIGSHLGHGKEEDAHEFLRYVIDTMQSVCLKESGAYALSPFAEETTLVGLIFGGYLLSKIKCMKCHGKTERHERMMDLTVEIQGDIGTLEEALGKFTSTEILDGENKYLCSRCKSYEKAKKKLTVLEAPNVLTIAFKRFQSGKYGKLNKSIRFPEVLNLGPYMSGKNDKSHEYKLYGVVVHVDVMNAAFSGHYVCYVKNLQGKWFKTNDSMVKPVELERVLSKGAYMLLYSRCSPQPPSFLRSATMPNSIKIRRDRPSEVITTHNSKKDSTTRARFSAVALRAGTSTSTAHRRPENYLHQMTLNGLSSIKSFDPFNRRLHHRPPIADSSSDSSSLFSCSDAGSCSTESTRDSTSTDDLSDYIFGESRYGYNSPWRGSDDSDVSCSSPFMRSSPSRLASPYTVTEADVFADGVEGLQQQTRFLYTDTSQNCINYSEYDEISVSNMNSSFSYSEINLEQLGWGNPLDVKSGVSLRRPTWERTAQTFY